MRTTIRLDDQLFEETKKMAAETGRSFTAIVEDSLRMILARRKRRERKSKIDLPTHRGGGVQPGVDLDSWASLEDLMEDRREAR